MRTFEFPASHAAQLPGPPGPDHNPHNRSKSTRLGIDPSLPGLSARPPGRYPGEAPPSQPGLFRERSPRIRLIRVDSRSDCQSAQGLGAFRSLPTPPGWRKAAVSRLAGPVTVGPVCGPANRRHPGPPWRGEAGQEEGLTEQTGRAAVAGSLLPRLPAGAHRSTSGGPAGSESGPAFEAGAAERGNQPTRFHERVARCGHNVARWSFDSHAEIRKY